MEIPVEFSAVLTGLIGFLVTQGLKSLSAFLARYKYLAWIDIRGWGSVITAFVVTGVTFYVRLGLSQVPEQYQAFLPSVWMFLVAVLSAFGAHLTVTYLSPKPAQNVAVEAASAPSVANAK